MIGDYIDLDRDRWKAILQWEARQCPEGGIVRHASRDEARERAALFADREQRLAAMAPKPMLVRKRA